jgi:UDP-3-O-[3-hydroxymyristoyl] glucosamine N-acyltransferase
VAIGHGASIGEHGLLVSLVGIAGSTRIGHHVTIGGQAGVAGHLVVGNRVTIAARGGVATDAADGAVLYGAPATPAPHGRKGLTLLGQLPEIVERIRKLEKRGGGGRKTPGKKKKSSRPGSG